MTLLAEPAGRSLERTGNRVSRGMIVHDRTRLIGQLLLNIPRNTILSAKLSPPLSANSTGSG